MEVGQALSQPLHWNVRLRQGFVPAEIHVVQNRGRGDRAGQLRPHVPLGFYDAVRAYPLQDPGVEPVESPRHDIGYAQLLQVRRGQDARLHVLTDHYRRGVEVGDVQVVQKRLVGGVRRDQMGMRVLGGEVLDEVLVGVYAEHLVTEGEQGIEHGAPQPTETDYDEVTTHDVAAFPFSR